MQAELNEVKRIALSAGRILMEYYARPASVDWKGPGDPVTTADRAASRYIVEELSRIFPHDAVLSEEEPDDRVRLRHSRVWMVDPMDGTNEFIVRSGGFAVMIGLAIEGTPALGVIYQPTARKLYYGAAGMGAFLAQGDAVTRLRVSPETVAAKLTIALSPTHSGRVEEIQERLRIKNYIRTGSVGLKVGLICEGLAHVYLSASNRTHVWDGCAPEAILNEAGGRMTDLSNEPLKYDQPEVRNLNGLIATNAAIHDRVVSVTKSVLAA